MREPMVIKLTEDERDSICSGRPVPAKVAKILSCDEDVFLKAPRPKLVHLADLPDGTVVKKGRFPLYVFRGQLFLQKEANGGYDKMFEAGNIKLSKGEWLPWLGGKCPWPDHVEVEVIQRNGWQRRMEATKLNWRFPSDTKKGGGAVSDIIAHRCTGRLLDGAKLVP